MKPRPLLRRSSISGLTLIELMVALAVLAILVAMAVPSFREISLNNRGSSIANELLADLSLSRSEAVKRAGTVTLRAVEGDWTKGWQVFVDANGNGVMDTATDELIKVAGALDGAGASNSFTLRAVEGATTGTTSMSRFTYGAMGQASAPAGGARFAACRPDGDAGKSIGIRVDGSGRAQSVRDLSALGLGCS